MRILSFLCLALLAFASSATESTAKFKPCPQVAVDVVVSKASIEYRVVTSGVEQKKSVQLEIETEPRIEIGDFNFDGLRDFSVWYLDEGMGKYTIHRVFIYDPKSTDFVEAAPRCGEEFLNLRVDKAQRSLLSTYYVNARPMKCSTRLNCFSAGK